MAGIEEAGERALAKLERLLPARLRGRAGAVSAATVTPRSARQGVDVEVLATVAAACRAHEVLRFDYARNDGEVGRRTVEPLGMVHTGRHWYLVAWDVDRRDWRTFRVDRLASRPVAAGRFTPRPAPAEDLAASSPGARPSPPTRCTPRCSSTRRSRSSPSASPPAAASSSRPGPTRAG